MSVRPEVRRWFEAVNRSVFICTVAAGEGVNGLTVTQVMQACYGPDPWLVLSIGKETFSHGLIEAAGLVALHYVGNDSVGLRLAEHFGTTSGRDGPKMQGIPFRLDAEGAPILADCPFHAVVRLFDSRDTPTHTVFFGRMVRAAAPPPGAPLLDVATLMQRPALAARPSPWDRW